MNELYQVSRRAAERVFLGAITRGANYCCRRLNIDAHQHLYEQLLPEIAKSDVSPDPLERSMRLAYTSEFED